VASGAGGLYVSAYVSFSEKLGYDVLSVDGLESLSATIESYMSAGGPRAIWSGLQSAEHRTIFSTSTSVQFLSFEIAGSSDRLVDTTTSVEEVANYYEQPEQIYHAESDSSDTANMILNTVSTSGYVLMVGGVVALLAGLFVASRRVVASPPTSAAPAKDYAELEATEHSTRRVQLKDLNLATPNAAALKQFVESVSLPHRPPLPPLSSCFVCLLLIVVA